MFELFYTRSRRVHAPEASAGFVVTEFFLLRHCHVLALLLGSDVTTEKRTEKLKSVRIRLSMLDPLLTVLYSALWLHVLLNRIAGVRIGRLDCAWMKAVACSFFSVCVLLFLFHVFPTYLFSVWPLD